MDENKILVSDFIPFSAVQSPDQKPPPAELSSVISRLDLVENRLDQVDNHIALLRDDFSEFTQTMEQKLDTLANQFATLHSMFLSMMKSSAQPTETSPPLVPESVSKSSDHQSGTSSPLAQGPDSPRPATPSKSQVLSAWNGTNSPIKAAASRSPPTRWPIRRSLPKPSRSQLRPSKLRTRRRVRRHPNRPSVHLPRRVPRVAPRPRRRLPIPSAALLKASRLPTAPATNLSHSTTFDPLRSGGGRETLRQDPRPSSGSRGVF